MEYQEKPAMTEGVKQLIKDLGWKFDHYTQSLSEIVEQMEAIATSSPEAAEAVALIFVKS